MVKRPLSMPFLKEKSMDYRYFLMQFNRGLTQHGFAKALCTIFSCAGPEGGFINTRAS